MGIFEFIDKLLPNRDNSYKRRIIELEKALQRLEKLYSEGRAPTYYFRVDKVQIDKVIVEKFDLNNNFANLGIKDLRGTMNIGANYGPGVPPPEEKGFQPDGGSENGGGDGAGPGQKEETGKEQGPKTNISYG